MSLQRFLAMESSNNSKTITAGIWVSIFLVISSVNFSNATVDPNDACIIRFSNAPNCTVQFKLLGRYSNMNATCIEPNTFVLPVYKPASSPNMTDYTASVSSIFSLPILKVTCTAYHNGLDFDFNGLGSLELIRIWKQEVLIGYGASATKRYVTQLEVLMTSEMTGQYTIYSHKNHTAGLLNFDVPNSNFTFFVFAEKTRKPFLVGWGKNPHHTSNAIHGPEEGQITLPCVTSNRDRDITLYKKDGSSSSSSNAWVKIEPLKRDYKKGLIIATPAEETTTFKCTTGITDHDFDSIIVKYNKPTPAITESKRPSLSFNGNTSTIICRSSDNSPVQLSIYFTKNPTESRLLENCLANGISFCGSHEYNQPIISEPSTDDSDCKAPSCAKIEGVHTEGLAFCTTIDSTHKQYVAIDYFTGLDGQIYTDWQLAPTTALIAPTWTPNNESLVLRSNYQFLCTTVRHLFVPNTYDLTGSYQNGTRSLLYGRRGVVTYTYYTTSSRYISANAHLEEVDCSAELWTHNEPVNTTTKLQYQDAICTSANFKCDNGKCINLSWKCDGADDCLDGSDERNCSSRTCPSGQFKCNSGKCIYSSSKCNNYVDCPGTEKEDETEEACAGKYCSTYDQFKCKTGQCITKSSYCDGRVDCLDGSDEEGCPECRSDQFKCTSGQCISATSVCDGSYTCRDYSDESTVACAMKNCTAEQFKCRNGRCVHAHYRCDGDLDCGDGSDENGCDEYAPTVKNGPNLAIFSTNATNNELICDVSVGTQTSSRKPVTFISWTHDGNNITDLRRLWRASDGLKVALKFFDIDIRDEGEYVCSATNKFGQSQYRVKVELAPGEYCPKDMNYHSCLLRKCYILNNECVNEQEFSQFHSKHQSLTDYDPDNEDSCSGLLAGLIILAILTLMLIGTIATLGLFGWRCYNTRLVYSARSLGRSSAEMELN